jgi:long-chain acyl-CoA synthetase
MGDPEEAILVAGDMRVSRKDYRDRVARAVTVLRELGVGAGSNIGIALRNRPQFLELAAAVTSLGAMAILVAWRLKKDEVRHLVEDSGATVVIYDREAAEAVAGLPALSLDDYEARLAAAVAAAIAEGAECEFSLQLYSSGTTGRPKAIEQDAPDVSQETRRRIALTFMEGLGIAAPDEVHLVSGPLYHSQPIGFSTFALMAGQRVVLMEGGFDAETWLRTVEQERVSWVTCVPTHFIRILALPEEVQRRYDLSSLKCVMHSAAPCPRDIKTAMMDLLPPGTVWEVYGGTEGAMTMISPDEALAKPGSVGRGFPPGRPLHIIDDDGNHLPPGEVGLVYSPAMVRFRYKGAPELDAETWRGDLYTCGDMGYLDEDGYLFLTDRKKDMIISGGANIYPAEVEAVLFNHPAVADTAVIGIPDAEWGERVLALVERRGAASAADIIAFCRDNLAHYKCPTAVEFVDRLPRDPNGKLRKRELRQGYWADAGRAV